MGRGVGAALAALVGGAIGSGCAGEPLRVEPLGRAEAPLVVDEDLALARRYAPWIYHAVHPELGRQDLPTRVDFDGNLRGDDNWEHMPRFELPPTAYYAVVESETHWFVSYHLFHPRDWSYARIGLHETHENDGESLQVVVDKASEQVVLLLTQAHYFGTAYADRGSGFEAGDEEVRAPVLRLDERGRPDPSGKHAGVFVEAYGHGVLGALDPCLELEVAADGTARFPEAGLVLRPAAEGEEVREPALDARAPVPYALESITAKLWPRLVDGSLVGEGGLLDGAVALEGPAGRVLVPRFYEADRFSGPFGPDRGISPFALCFSFFGDVGDLLFDPARAYAAALRVPARWSTRYVDYPFTLPADAR